MVNEVSKQTVDIAQVETRKVYNLVKDEKSSSNVTTVFRTNFQNAEEVMEWFEQYKEETSTDWIVKENPKSVQRLVCSLFMQQVFTLVSM